MRISEAGVGLIKRFEGLKLAPYWDHVGYPTIGYGHLLSHVRFEDLGNYAALKDEIEAVDLLRHDLTRYVSAVNRLIRVPLTQGQFDALSSFTFNLGTGALQSSTLRRVINRGDYGDAPYQLSRWVRAGGRKSKGLIRRRRIEAIFGELWAMP